jgi:hypothetical protein
MGDRCIGQDIHKNPCHRRSQLFGADKARSAIGSDKKRIFHLTGANDVYCTAGTNKLQHTRLLQALALERIENEALRAIDPMHFLGSFGLPSEALPD